MRPDALYAKLSSLYWIDMSIHRAGDVTDQRRPNIEFACAMNRTFACVYRPSGALLLVCVGSLYGGTTQFNVNVHEQITLSMHVNYQRIF